MKAQAQAQAQSSRDAASKSAPQAGAVPAPAPGAPSVAGGSSLRRSQRLGHRLGETFGLGPPMDATSGPRIQRMIVRIRDLQEMMSSKNNTIENSAERIKKMFPETDVRSREDVGINQAADLRQLDVGEALVVVAHASAPSLSSFLRSGIPKMGGYAPGALAAKLSPLFPDNYSGRIYMDGCSTGKRLAYQEGTSYIERFAAALAVLRPDITSTVQGNIGLASTTEQGLEQIEISPEEAAIGRSRGWQVYEVEKDSVTKYVVISPFGQAFARMDGNFNDMGLSVEAQHLAEEKARQAAERRRRARAEEERQRRTAVIRGTGNSVNAFGEGNYSIGNDEL